jgi:drug/metabolite transporter (DMT)-like permease
VGSAVSPTFLNELRLKPAPPLCYRKGIPSQGIRTTRLLALVIILKPVSNLLLAYGVQHFPAQLAWNPRIYVDAILDPFVAGGVLLQIWWLLSRMALLGVADLSFVLPVTAMGYMLTSLLGKFLLHEILTPARWAGIALVSIGSMLVGGDRRNTTNRGTQ